MTRVLHISRMQQPLDAVHPRYCEYCGQQLHENGEGKDWVRDEHYHNTCHRDGRLPCFEIFDRKV